jgi:hypothetical protein
MPGNGWKPSRCTDRECRAEIAWLPTKNGSRAPVEIDSLSEDDISALEAKIPVLFRPQEHKNHFITCPGAERFRKRFK